MPSRDKKTGRFVSSKQVNKGTGKRSSTRKPVNSSTTLDGTKKRTATAQMTALVKRARAEGEREAEKKLKAKIAKVFSAKKTSTAKRKSLATKRKSSNVTAPW
jgi:hypothetical protein